MEQISAALTFVALVFLMGFAAYWRSYWRDKGMEALSAFAFAGAIFFTVGFSFWAGYAYALADVSKSLDLPTAQTLNLLHEDVFFTAFIGVVLFAVGSGLAILCSQGLPKWLGWTAIAIGVLAFTPAIDIGLLALGAWVIVVSLVAWRRLGFDVKDL